MHVSYYYKKVKIPTYIYNGGEGEEALFFSFLVFFSVYVYMSDKSTVKIDSILYPYLHTCFHLYTNTKKITKRRNSCLVFAPHHLISLQAGSTASRAFIKNKKKTLLQEQLAIGLESSLPYWPITGPSPRMPPT